MMILKKSLAEEIITYAKSNFPNECCGYLFGLYDMPTDQNTIKQIFKMTNTHKNRQNFFMFSPEEQLEALIKSKKENLDIVGIFHSHPHSIAYPSDEDIKYMYTSTQSYIIISLLDEEPKIKSFRFKEKKIYEEGIKN
ncbi:hypothetical protein BKH42_05840 [Helicobacter sp. 13S00482-2]|uniref:Mov34/MPN/PAD-1 family protein n=1 Tax=Helicobacter sp. 13S00482-2 TaxID=1476200 RepID=UPI000BA7B597|nr:M67 family metallopeptidase [Helicobacter sp. 13S00482-2]PAF53444.1 hypothetical protein BKH42_05840 [Helicobacter sp. 13S00482-2]